MSQVPEVRVDTYLGASPLPEIDEKELAAAARKPNGEIRYFDPNQPKFAPLGHLQLMGVRAVGPDGTFTGEEWRNPEFVPHPKTAGGVEFANHFEVQLWRMLNGFVQLGTFVGAFAEAEFQVGCDSSDVLGVVPDTDGPTLDVYTTPARVEAGKWPRWMTIVGTDVLKALGRDPALGIRFNGEDWPGLRWPTSDLLQLWQEREALLDDFMRTGPLPTASTTMGTVAAPAGGNR
ncbi:hypothetical protein PV646_07685 [Streptomyces sp. ID05-26A]|nr:hypothetical protein [Streptomyces sp. ID05-26A]